MRAPFAHAKLSAASSALAASLAGSRDTPTRRLEGFVAHKRLANHELINVRFVRRAFAELKRVARKAESRELAPFAASSFLLTLQSKRQEKAISSRFHSRKLADEFSKVKHFLLR